MNVSRRWFIGGCGSFAALGWNRVFAAPAGAYTKDAPLLRFGVLSDVHLCSGGTDWKLRKGYDGRTLTDAFTWFRAQGVDGVAIAGDIAHSGLGPDLKNLADIWFAVFPDDRGLDGRPVERLFITGNHDNSGMKYAKYTSTEAGVGEKYAIELNRAKWWDEAFHEEFKPCWRKTVKGFDFIGCNWMNGTCKGKNEAFNDEMVPFYDALGGKLDPKRPFFHLQHPQPKATAHGALVWGQDDGRGVRCLEKHPNAVAFSGHSHISLLDEQGIWQGSFTSVGTASLRDVSLRIPGVGTLPACGFENNKAPGKNPEDGEKAMAIPPRNGRQGQLVSVYEDRIVFTRRDFTLGLPLGDDLVMPLPAAEKRPFDHALRSAASLAPEFPQGAAVKVSRRPGKLRKKAKGKPVAAEVWHLEIPKADAVRNSLAVAYEVTAKTAAGKEKTFWLTVPDAFTWGRGSKRAAAPIVMDIACSRVAAEPSFKVRAVNCWGKKSVAIYDA